MTGIIDNATLLIRLILELLPLAIKWFGLSTEHKKQIISTIKAEDTTK
jgi:hypothetical protein